MISILSEYDSEGTFVRTENIGSIGSAPTGGVYGIGYYPARSNPFLTSQRSDLDYLWTGQRGFAGDHDCDNLQLAADVVLHPSLTGPFVPFDPLYGITVSSRLEPSSIAGYSLPQAIGRWGPTPSSGLQAAWRTSSDAYALKAYQSAAFLYRGNSWQRCYSLKTSSVASRRWTMETMVAATRVIETADPRYPMYYMVRLYVARVYNSLGVEQTPTVACYTRVTACGPSSSTSTVAKVYSLSPLGVWGGTTFYKNPSYLSTPTLSAAIPFLANPYGLLREAPPGSYRDGLIKFPNTYVPKEGPICVSGNLVGGSEDVVHAISEQFAPKMPVLLAIGSRDDWAELGDDCADNIQQVSINTLAYITDVSKTFGTIRETLRLARDWKSPKQWAAWWLSLRYGDRLTISDTSTLVEAARESVTSPGRWMKYFYTSRSASTATTIDPGCGCVSVTKQHFMKLYFQPLMGDFFADAYHFLDQWDLWPTLSNAWDLVPLSFVVDWFVDVQGVLERVSRYDRLLMNKVLSVIQTEKTTFVFDDFDIGSCIATNVRISDYHRDLCATLPSAPFRVDRGHLSTVNIVDGLSLIFQRF